MSGTLTILCNVPKRTWKLGVFRGGTKNQKKNGVQLKTPPKKKVKTTLPIFVVPFCKLEVWKPKKKKKTNSNAQMEMIWVFPLNGATPKTPQNDHF